MCPKPTAAGGTAAEEPSAPIPNRALDIQGRTSPSCAAGHEQVGGGVTRGVRHLRHTARQVGGGGASWLGMPRHFRNSFVSHWPVTQALGGDKRASSSRRFNRPGPSPRLRRHTLASLAEGPCACNRGHCSARSAPLPACPRSRPAHRPALPCLQVPAARAVMLSCF